MSDRPIIFSAPMVKALLAGRKMQTRRILRNQPEKMSTGKWHVFGAHGGCFCDEHDVGREAVDYVPYAVGDRLYVRENFYQFGGPVEYAADAATPSFKRKMTPCIHMPRWASRLTLTVTGVRVQPLLEISDDDAVAEGLYYMEEGEAAGFWFASEDGKTPPNVWGEGSVECYARLWDSLHGPGAWDANPWIVAVTFTVEQANIDVQAQS